MQKYDNGKASIEATSDSIIAEKEYVFPSKRNDLEAAFRHTLDDCLRMKRVLEKIIKASDYTNAGENCKLLAEQALKRT
jgi:hypothetical protein